MNHPKRNDTSARRTRNGGFTVLETLVAIAILIISITGPMVFAQQSLRAARLSRDQVTAFYPAQDAVELVKHVRDVNSFTTFRDEWLSGLEECFASSIDENSGCQVSVPDWTIANSDEAIVPCPGANCPLWEDNGLFGTFPGSPSKVDSRFSRRVRIMTPSGGNPGDLVGVPPLPETEEVLVEVEVTRTTTGVGERSVLVREHIYNWIQ